MVAAHSSGLRRLKAALLLALLVACPNGGEPAGDLSSGIEGIVLIGPTCPVEQQGSPCPDRPVAATITITRINGAVVKRATSSDDGRFRVSLEPGRYFVSARPLDESAPGGESPVVVEVLSDAFTEVEITIDSGIR